MASLALHIAMALIGRVVLSDTQKLAFPSMAFAFRN